MLPQFKVFTLKWLNCFGKELLSVEDIKHHEFLKHILSLWSLDSSDDPFKDLLKYLLGKYPGVQFPDADSDYWENEENLCLLAILLLFHGSIGESIPVVVQNSQETLDLDSQIQARSCLMKINEHDEKLLSIDDLLKATQAPSYNDGDKTPKPIYKSPISETPLSVYFSSPISSRKIVLTPRRIDQSFDTSLMEENDKLKHTSKEKADKINQLESSLERKNERIQELEDALLEQENKVKELISSKTQDQALISDMKDDKTFHEEYLRTVENSLKHLETENMRLVEELKSAQTSSEKWKTSANELGQVVEELQSKIQQQIGELTELRDYYREAEEIRKCKINVISSPCTPPKADNLGFIVESKLLRKEEEVVELQQEIQNLQKALAEEKSLRLNQPVDPQIFELTDQVEKLQGELGSINKEKEDCVSSLTFVTSERDTLSSLKKNHEKKIAGLENSQFQLKLQVAELRTQLDFLQSEKNDFKLLYEACSKEKIDLQNDKDVAVSQLKSVNRKCGTLTQQVTELEQSVSTNKLAYEKLATEKRNLEKQMLHNESNSEEVAQLTAEKEKLNTQNRHLLRENESLKSSLNSANELREKTDEQIITISEDNLKLKGDLHMLNKELSTVTSCKKVAEEELANLRAHNAVLLTDVEESSIQREALENQVKDLSQKCEEQCCTIENLTSEKLDLEDDICNYHANVSKHLNTIKALNEKCLDLEQLQTETIRRLDEAVLEKSNFESKINKLQKDLFEKESQIQQLIKEKEQMEKEKKEIDSSLRLLQSSRNDLTSELKKKEGEVHDLLERIRNIEDTVHIKSEMIEDLNEKLLIVTLKNTELSQSQKSIIEQVKAEKLKAIEDLNAKLKVESDNNNLLAENHRSIIQKLKNEKEKENENFNSKLKAESEKYNQMAENHKSVIQLLKKEKEQEIGDLNAKLKIETEKNSQLAKNHKSVLEQLKHDKEKEVEDLNARLKIETEKNNQLVKNHESVLELLKAEKIKAIEDLTAKLKIESEKNNQLVENHKSVLGLLKAEKIKAIEDLTAKLKIESEKNNQLVENHESVLEQLKQDKYKEIEDLNAKLKIECDKSNQLAKNQKCTIDQLKKEEAQMKQIVESENDSHKKLILELQKQLDSYQNETIPTNLNKLLKAEQDIEDLRRQNEALQRKLLHRDLTEDELISETGKRDERKRSLTSDVSSEISQQEKRIITSRSMTNLAENTSYRELQNVASSDSSLMLEHARTKNALKEAESELNKRMKELVQLREKVQEQSQLEEKMHKIYSKKLENMREDMKNFAKDENEKLAVKHEQTEKLLIAKYNKCVGELEDHIQQLSSQLLDLGEKLLREQQAHKATREKHAASYKQQHQFSVPAEPNRNFARRRETLAQVPMHTRQSQRAEFSHDVNDGAESSSGRRSTMMAPASMGVAFPEEDEPGEVFNHDFLLDMKAGRCKVDTESSRLDELKFRNSLCPPHLKSSYPVETQIHDVRCFKDDDLKGAVDQKHKGKDYGVTYKKPGPPTPGRRASIGNKDEGTPRSVLRDHNDSSVSGIGLLRAGRSTPNRLRALFKSSKVGSVSTPPKGGENPSGGSYRKKGNIFNRLNGGKENSKSASGSGYLSFM